MAKSAAQNFCLDGRAEGHCFVRVLGGVELRALGFVVLVAQAQVSAGFFELRATKPVRHALSDQGHPGLSTDQNHLVQIFGFQLRVAECAEAVRASFLDNAAGEGFQL